MKVKNMDKLQAHFEKYFNQKMETILHPMINETELHIDVMLFKPTEEFPFWKMVTMGASDFKMPKGNPFISQRNEYIMFIDKEVDISQNSKDWFWYYSTLIKTATFPFLNNDYISYGHTIEMESNEETEMKGVMLLLPMIIPNANILKCKAGKDIACLQVMPITEQEMNGKLENGATWLENIFYPEDDTQPIFLAEKYRK